MKRWTIWRISQAWVCCSHGLSNTVHESKIFGVSPYSHSVREIGLYLELNYQQRYPLCSHSSPTSYTFISHRPRPHTVISTSLRCFSTITNGSSRTPASQVPESRRNGTSSKHFELLVAELSSFHKKITKKLASPIPSRGALNLFVVCGFKTGGTRKQGLSAAQLTEDIIDECFAPEVATTVIEAYDPRYLTTKTPPRQGRAGRPRGSTFASNPLPNDGAKKIVHMVMQRNFSATDAQLAAALKLTHDQLDVYPGQPLLV